MNIKILKRNKDENIKLADNFTAKEFFCKCGKCENQLVDLDHVAKLQKLREDLGSSININSAYRCPSHNAAVGGATNSIHKTGSATDIVVKGMDPSETADACEHFDGLGRYDTFTHIDSRGSKARWDNRTRKKAEHLPDGPSVDDIDITLEDIEKNLGL